MKKLLNRFAEPSTWAGLSVIGGLLSINPAIFTNLHGVVVGLAGLAAVFIPEKTAQ